MAAVHEGKKLFQCPLCKDSFSEKGNIRRHISTVHDSNKPHKCSMCKYECKAKSSLKSHISAVHEREKPFKCCLKVVHDKNNQSGCFPLKNEALKSNLQEEKNFYMKPYKCSNCDASFAQKAPLIDHVESVHNIKRSSIDFIPRMLLIKIGK